MRKFYICTVLIIIFQFTFNNIYSQNSYESPESQKVEESSLLLRPNTSIGFIEDELVYSVGLRVLLKAGGNKSYGLEFSRYGYSQNGSSFITAGIILEQKLFDWFNMSIGTIGYFNYGDESRNVVGLTSNLGWEPYSEKRISPFITYRSDLIFATNIKSINALNLGLNIKII